MAAAQVQKYRLSHRYRSLAKARQLPHFGLYQAENSIHKVC